MLSMRPGGGGSVVMPRAVAVQEQGLLAPRIYPAGGRVHNGDTVVIENHSANPECAIFYTTNGTEPSIHSHVYEGPFTVHPPYEPQIAVRAVSAASLTKFSSPATEIFSFEKPPGLVTPDPVWDVNGSYVNIIHNPAATVYYSTTPDGNPLDGGKLFAGPFTMHCEGSEETVILTAVAVMEGRAPSRAVTATVKLTGRGAKSPGEAPIAATIIPQAKPPPAETAPHIKVSYTAVPPTLTVSPMGDAPAHIYYRKDAEPFQPFPANNMLTIPLLETHHLYAFISSKDPLDLANFDIKRHPVTYLFIPRRPEFECDTDVGYILEQAIKWLWEVVSRLQVVHDQVNSEGWARDKPELTRCAGKMESAILLALFHLKTGAVVYEGLEIIIPDSLKLNTKHYTEANDATMTLYHTILEVQRKGSDENLTALLEKLKAAMHKIRTLLALLPDEAKPDANETHIPRWLILAKQKSCDTVSDNASTRDLLKATPDIAKCCAEHNNEAVGEADEVKRLLLKLTHALQTEADEKDRLQADLHQAKVNADELTNNIDTQLAWIQAARLREARMEATIEELRRGGGAAAPPAPVVHPIAHTPGIDSHLAFLISPD